MRSACASRRARPTKTLPASGEEVEALFTNGPAGGGGVRKATTEQVGIVSCLVPRDLVATDVALFEA